MSTSSKFRVVVKKLFPSPKDNNSTMYSGSATCLNETIAALLKEVHGTRVHPYHNTEEHMPLWFVFDNVEGDGAYDAAFLSHTSNEGLLYKLKEHFDANPQTEEAIRALLVREEDADDAADEPTERLLYMDTLAVVIRNILVEGIRKDLVPTKHGYGYCVVLEQTVDGDVVKTYDRVQYDKKNDWSKKAPRKTNRYKTNL